MMSARMEVETKGWYVRFAGNLSTLLRMCLMSYGIKEGEKFQANTFVLFISDDGSCSDGTFSQASAFICFVPGLAALCLLASIPGATGLIVGGSSGLLAAVPGLMAG